MLRTISALFGLFMLLIAISGCQQELSTAEVERITKSILDAQAADPRFEERQEKAIRMMANTMMEHPSMQTTPKEDCATAIVIAVVMMEGTIEPPDDSETTDLCEWYIRNIEER